MEANFPMCEQVREGAFYPCESLTTANFPACTSLYSEAFYGCYNLKTVNFQALEYIGSGAFKNCSSLTALDLPACRGIYNSAFRNCSCLSIVQLGRGSTNICRLNNSNAFTSTPFTGYGPYFSDTPHIYVPGLLIRKYQSATNWVYFSSYFSPIPGTEDDMWDGTLITFTIDGVEYQAEKSTTWGDWINSPYNVDGFSDLYNWGYPGHEDKGLISEPGDSFYNGVTIDDFIIANVAYVCR